MRDIEGEARDIESETRGERKRNMRINAGCQSVVSLRAGSLSSVGEKESLARTL